MSRSEKIRERLFECIHNGEIENADMVQIIEHLSIILNLTTLSDYAQKNNISYNGAKKRKHESIVISNQSFIINNA